MKRVVIAVTVAAMLALAAMAVAKGSGLNGSWQTTIKTPKQLKGTWVVKFTPGHYNVKLGKTPIVHGTDTIKGNKVSLTDSGGQGACKATGVYKFKITGNKLNFTKVKDGKGANCLGRAAVLSHTFTKVK